MIKAAEQTRLIDRRELCKLLGKISVSQVIRLERAGPLKNAKVSVGIRAIRYNLSKVLSLIEASNIVPHHN